MRRLKQTSIGIVLAAITYLLADKGYPDGLNTSVGISSDFMPAVLSVVAMVLPFFLGFIGPSAKSILRSLCVSIVEAIDGAKYEPAPSPEPKGVLERIADIIRDLMVSKAPKEQIAAAMLFAETCDCHKETVEAALIETAPETPKKKVSK